jgi:HD superfamily phosphohydrolase
MAEKLLPQKENDEKRRIIRLSALLHDIGHGPFSHISEDILDKYSYNAGDSPKERIHEKITAKLIQTDKELKQLLSPNEIENIIGLLSGQKVDISLMKEIVSGPLDADKMDYLLRDSYFCGVKYGVFDIHRMLNTLTTYDDNFDTHIAISDDGINSLEQFVLAKYYMLKQVYCHRIRSIADSMIIRGIELGIEKDEIEFLNRIYRYKENEEYLKQYLGYWDDKVLNELVFSDKKGYAKEIFERLYHRKLFKRIFSVELKNIEIKSEKLKDKVINIAAKENEILRKQIEEHISQIDSLVCKKEYVIVNCFTIKSVRETSRESEGGILIIDRAGNKKNFEEESTVFSSIDESMKDVYFEVYAPLESVDQKDKKTKIALISQEILNILKKMEV